MKLVNPDVFRWLLHAFAPSEKGKNNSEDSSQHIEKWWIIHRLYFCSLLKSPTSLFVCLKKKEKEKPKENNVYFVLLAYQSWSAWLSYEWSECSGPAEACHVGI